MGVHMRTSDRWIERARHVCGTDFCTNLNQTGAPVSHRNRTTRRLDNRSEGADCCRELGRRDISFPADMDLESALTFPDSVSACFKRAASLVELSGRNSRNVSMIGTSPRASVGYA